MSFRKGFEIPGANGTTDRVVLPYEKKGPSPKISGRKSAKKGMLAKKTAPVKNITPAKKTASARKVVVERKTPTPKKKVNLKGAAKKVRLEEERRMERGCRQQQTPTSVTNARMPLSSLASVLLSFLSGNRKQAR